MKLLSYEYMFPIIQLILPSLLVFALIKSIPIKGASLSIERGQLFIAIFYGFYLAASGLMIGLCLSTETKLAKDYKVFWTIFLT